MIFLAVALVTGIYLFLLYQVSDPYGSVARLDATWFGSLMRSMHRYSADLAVVCVAVHVIKMLAAGRTWGPRALAWLSGLGLLAMLLLCGWTGLVMAWDVQGQLVALEGARLLDLVPLFSEPISRSFSEPGGVGGGFFFLNLFAHVALPLGFAAVLWLHASRVARATLFPPRVVTWYVVGLLVVLSLLLPVPLPPAADVLSVPHDLPLDVFYAFWLPVARALSPALHLAFWLVLGAVAISVPWWWRPRVRSATPSKVEEERCSGCSQCYFDCPFEAIRMVPRDTPSPLSEIVARVDPALCVSCGICAGSCAPMSVGPSPRSGRDQLGELATVLERQPPSPERVVVLACGYGPGLAPSPFAPDDVVTMVTACSGSVHSAVLERLLTSGYAGVLVLTCAERDCLFREGPKWLHERAFHDREAELKARVDKRRLRIAACAASEPARARRLLAAFRSDLATLGEAPQGRVIQPDLECEPVDVSL